LRQQSRGTVVCKPKALLRNDATRVFIDLDADDAVVSGPNLTVKLLKTELERFST